MFCANLMIRSHNGPFEKGPCVFYAICVNISTHPFFLTVLYSIVFVTSFTKICIGCEFVSHNVRAFVDSIFDNTPKNSLPGGWDRLCLKLAFPLQQSHDRLLFPRSARSSFVVFAPHIGFVHFHYAIKLWTRRAL